MNEMRIFYKQNSQSGQALVEYVLLLVIAIALILGLANQLYKPFGAWMKDYMGQYVECLLDMGELPTIGGSSASGECASKFKSFTVQNGWPPIKEPTKPSSTAGSSDDSPGSNQSSRNNSSSAASGGGGGRKGSRATSIGRNAGADGISENSRGEKQLTEKLPEAQYYKLRSSNGSFISSSGNSSESRNGIMIPIGIKSESIGSDRTVRISTNADMDRRSNGKKLVIAPAERKPAKEDDDQPWSFGQYIKFALILVIIIAIVLFLGGQILQISKGREK